MCIPARPNAPGAPTHYKNPRFSNLHRTGEAEDFHQFYQEVAERYQPEEIFVSGGEPLLYPRIGSFLRDLSKNTSRIHVFTSYQFNRQTMDRFAGMDLPLEKIVLNHTPIYFEPENWHKLTQGFPFEVYIDNIRNAVGMHLKKRFKFIINHSGFVEEVQRFQDLVQPNQTCEISLKMMNQQGADIAVPTMQKTADRVRERLGDLDQVLKDAGWSNRPRPTTSADVMRPVIENDDVTRCVYRHDPLELRLSYYRGGDGDGKKILKYRYCPYFPPDFGHKFHIGRDDLRKLGRNFQKGPFREHCDRCRIRHYCEAKARRLHELRIPEQVSKLGAGRFSESGEAFLENICGSKSGFTRFVASLESLPS